MIKGAYFFIALIILVALIVLGYVGVALYRIAQYNRLSAQAKVENVTWSVKAFSAERYTPHAEYDFKVQGQTYHGGTTLSLSPYKNAWAVEQEIKQISPQYKTVWYDPSNPAFSSLERYFPTKQVTYAAILLSILFYFSWGGYMYTKNWLKWHSKTGKDDPDRLKK